MPAFTSFNNRLPDPAFSVNDAGAQVASGKKGPGFASISLRSVKDTQVSRTISGRGVHRGHASHHWEIDINYHPMQREQFDVVQTFLDARDARMHPFYVVLPQHSKPKNINFVTTVTGSTIRTVESKSAGNSFIKIDINNGATVFNASSGYPSPGDYFNVSDPADANHQKTYKITRVETAADYNSTFGSFPSSQVRIHFTPPLVRDVPNDAVIKFLNPEFRVIAKQDVLEYSLNTDNLYQFQLQLEEIQP